MMGVRLSSIPVDVPFTRERDGVCLGLWLIALWRNSGTEEPGNPVVFVLWLRKHSGDCAIDEAIRREAAARMVLPLCFAEGPRLEAAMQALTPVPVCSASSVSGQTEPVTA